MARIKLAYIGGGSTRAPGTMASFIHQGQNFQGSEVVLIDLEPERLAIVRQLAEKMARAQGVDLTVRHYRPAHRAGRLRRGADQLPAGRLRGALH